MRWDGMGEGREKRREWRELSERLGWFGFRRVWDTQAFGRWQPSSGQYRRGDRIRRAYQGQMFSLAGFWGLEVEEVEEMGDGRSVSTSRMDA